VIAAGHVEAAVTQQEGQQLLALAAEIITGGFARPDEITDRGT
jgi:hypothetical protein